MLRPVALEGAAVTALVDALIERRDAGLAVLAVFPPQLLFRDFGRLARTTQHNKQLSRDTCLSFELTTC